MSASRAIYLLAGKRTPFGALCGKLANLSSTELAVICSKAAIAESKINLEQFDNVYFGNVIQSSSDAAYLARHIGLKCGIPVKSPALTLNRLCGSGFEAVIQGAEAIELKRSSVSLCGGTENMSQSPLSCYGPSFRNGYGLGVVPQYQDALWSGLSDSYINMPMGITAENLADEYKISRQDCDEFALRSQTLHKKAVDSGRFTNEICPIEIKLKKKGAVEMMTADEHPRPTSTIETLAKLSSVFRPEGRVTAGNASGICDGAASIVVANEEATKSSGVQPMARLVAWTRVGCNPSTMGIGPAPAIRQLLKITNKTLNDIDLIEVNEAFAAQTIAVERDLGLDRNKLNVNGGAIALGHPLGASGARLVCHLMHELKRQKKKFGIGSACIGGGQGIAVLIESL